MSCWAEITSERDWPFWVAYVGERNYTTPEGIRCPSLRWGFTREQAVKRCRKGLEREEAKHAKVAATRRRHAADYLD